METCKHHGEGCSPAGAPRHKCAGYFEHSFGCEHYVCDNHVHRSRYGTFCDACYPAPPVFARPRTATSMQHLAGRAVQTAMTQGAILRH